MSINHYSADYINVTARMAMLKAKAVSTCQLHPDILILCPDHEAQNRAYMIAKNTLVYHDKMFLFESLTDAIKHQLSLAGVECVQCMKNNAYLLSL